MIPSPWTTTRLPGGGLRIDRYRPGLNPVRRTRAAVRQRANRYRRSGVFGMTWRIPPTLYAAGCGDCPIGGRDGSGPVCPRVAQCDRDCEELVRIGRAEMGREPGEACCRIMEAAAVPDGGERLRAILDRWDTALRRMTGIGCGPDCRRPECVHGAMANHAQQGDNHRSDDE